MHTTLIGGDYHGKIIEHSGLDVIHMPPKPAELYVIDSSDSSQTDREIELLVYTKRNFVRRGEPISVFALADMTDDEVIEAIS